VFKGDPEDLRGNGPAGFTAMEPVECEVGAEDRGGPHSLDSSAV
jgi:hypothetical protein